MHFTYNWSRHVIDISHVRGGAAADAAARGCAGAGDGSASRWCGGSVIFACGGRGGAARAIR